MTCSATEGSGAIDHIRIDKRDGILTLTLDRPDKKNALTDAMYGTLADALEAAQEDKGVRVVLIRSEGDCFSAGNDIGEFAAAAREGGGLNNVLRFIRAIALAAKPLVAAVHGPAVGVGTTMLLHCDYVIVSEAAQLMVPFVNLALVPEAGSSLLLPARIGHVRAFAMFALGESLGPEEAVALGLANAVVPASDLAASAEDVARRLAVLPPGALAATKKLMRRSEAIVAHMDEESREFVARLTTAEANEAFLAFAQRRPPDFSRFS